MNDILKFAVENKDVLITFVVALVAVIKLTTWGIRSLKSEVKTKVSGDTLWKTAGLVIALGGIISGVVSSIISYFGM